MELSRSRLWALHRKFLETRREEKLAELQSLALSPERTLEIRLELRLINAFLSDDYADRLSLFLPH